MGIHLVICTKDRYQDLHDLMVSINYQECLPKEILVVDSSENRKGLDLEEFPNIRHLIRVIEHTPHLTAQRNIALNSIQPSDSGGIIIFLDDDVVIATDALKKVLETFENNLQIAGLTGVDINSYDRPIDDKWTFGELFFLKSRKSGKILPSGINIGMKPSSKSYNVDWLPGCFMAFRISSIVDLRFDEKLWFWGEDVDFTSRLSNSSNLICDPTILYIHKLSENNREHSEFAEIENYKRRIGLTKNLKSVKKIFILISVLGQFTIKIFKLLRFFLAEILKIFNSLYSDIRRLVAPDRDDISNKCTLKHEYVVLRGGLGNQLFIYTYAIFLKEQRGRNVKFDLSSYNQNLRSFQIQDLISGDEIENSNHECEQIEEFQLDRYSKLEKSNCIKYLGYFQDIKYFPQNHSQYSHEIRNKLFSNFKSNYQLEDFENIAIHLRRGDYVNNSNYELTRFEFFMKSVYMIRQRFGAHFKVYIFSDDSDSAERLRKFIPNSTIFDDSQLSSLEIMYNLSNFKFIVCSNSTFSWWASFLNVNEDKTIVIPSNWFGSDLGKVKKLVFQGVEVF